MCDLWRLLLPSLSLSLILGPRSSSSSSSSSNSSKPWMIQPSSDPQVVVPPRSDPTPVQVG